MLRPQQDLGTHVTTALCGITGGAGAPIAIIADSTGDAVAVTGATINRMSNNSPINSGLFQVYYSASLTAAETLSLAVEYQQSSDGSSWDTAVALRASSVVATGGGGGSIEEGVLTYELDLTGFKQYVRVNFTPNLSDATNTDTAIVLSAFTGGGFKFME